MEQSDVKSMLRQSSFDGNNNQIADDDSVEDSETTDQLVEAINGRLLEQSQSSKESNNKHKSDAKDEEDAEGGEECDDKSLISDGDFDALDEEEEEEEEQSDDIDSQCEDAAVDKVKQEEPYDVDNVLISTFLEHTTSIVRMNREFLFVVSSPPYQSPKQHKL